ncbi:trypsin-like serine peptidase [Psychromicrobium sp. YIM B11713]|uniref:trypsin-like serine peptidase n=1 Tax=Psychromicrobium sp. YIM B11713 TaxID=3145233 RepID=UPI00374E5723
MSAAGGVLIALAALVFSSGAATAAAPEAVDSSVTTPVGVKIVNGVADTANPLSSAGLTDSVGFTSTPASFPGAESVIGADTRKQITDTLKTPYRGLVELSGGSLSGCTGWMISADTLVTAGHCVWDGSSYTADFTASPARNDTKRPFGTCQAAQVWTDQQWLSNYDQNFDWAVVKLNCTVGTQTGWFGYKTDSDGNLANLGVTVSGYPGDKPWGQVWSDSNKVAQVTATKVWYPNDTFGGESGSPVYNSAAQAIAIHAYGNDGSGNSGTRIKPQLFNTLTHLKNAGS